ncbi:MAG: hypothetical protein ACPGQD_06575 [Planctomycetota bacterium]
MARAVTPQDRYRYVLKADRELPEEEQTVWWFRALTAKETAKLEDLLGYNRSTDEVRLNLGTTLANTLKAGLVDCENLLDEEGAVVEFERSEKTLNLLGENLKGLVTDRFLGRIHPEDRKELADAIHSGAYLRKEAKKA